MKKMLKTFSLLLLGVATLSSTLTAKADTIDTQTKSSNVQQLLDLNDPNWNEFLGKTNLDYSKATVGETYVKVYESPTKTIVDDKTYTYEEYSKAKASDNAAKWLKFNYEIYPMWNNSKEASAVIGYEWLSTPEFQLEDIFTVSSNSTAVVPGSNSNINVSYWPNVGGAPSVVKSYTNSNNRSNFQFDANGISIKHDLRIKKSDSATISKIEALGNGYEVNKYFTRDSDGNYRTKGRPKATMGIVIKSPTTNPYASKLQFTYHHRQVSANFNPTISISASGNVTVSGFTGGMGYDKANTSIDYKWGSTIG